MIDDSASLIKSFLKEGEKAKKYLKNNKILTLAILITVSGCFFSLQIYRLLPAFYANAYEEKGKDKIKNYELSIDGNILAVLPAGLKKGECEKGISNGKCQPKKSDLERELFNIVGDYPIKEMIPHIAKFNRRTAALIVGIAKKESNWGRRIPTKNGETCYNYWGYKGQGSRGMAMGYGCFGSPKEGVEAIGERIEELANKDLNTPSKMVVWKCGRSCAGHSPESVRKWISDVSIYFNLVTGLKG